MSLLTVEQIPLLIVGQIISFLTVNRYVITDFGTDRPKVLLTVQ